ncbi:MAG TPA: MBL fold metallo-hydrolase [Spirochaetia bacterium]|nr:MBL fold metallo-hydrolase [Spirochaetia bacterium]
MADKISATRTIGPGFYIAGFGFVCMYLLETTEGFVAFDTGLRSAAVERELKRLSIDPAAVRHVFLTHSDHDHLGGLPAFPAASLYLSRDEVPMITRRIPRFFTFIFNKRIDRDYRELSDGDEITVGNHVIRAISTPGHTSGSMSFLIDGSILIVGDELGLKGGRAVLDRRMLAVDNARRRESILRLSRLQGVSLLCTMHHGYTPNFDEAMGKWRDAGHAVG